MQQNRIIVRASYRLRNLYRVSYDRAETEEENKDKSSLCPERVFSCVVQFRVSFRLVFGLCLSRVHNLTLESMIWLPSRAASRAVNYPLFY
jgi:hypothetical protein